MYLIHEQAKASNEATRPSGVGTGVLYFTNKSVTCLLSIACALVPVIGGALQCVGLLLA